MAITRCSNSGTPNAARVGPIRRSHQVPSLERSQWYDLTRDMNWTFTYVDEKDVFPEELSNSHGIAAEDWWGWDEPYKVTYTEYVHNQFGKDASVYAVNAVVGRSKIFESLDPGWKSAIIAHYGAIAVPRVHRRHR